MSALKTNRIIKSLVIINLLVLSEVSLAGGQISNEGELRQAARELQINLRDSEPRVLRNASGLWVKEPGKPGHLLGDENTNFGRGAYDNSPFTALAEDETDLESPFDEQQPELVFPIQHEDLLRLSLGEISSGQLERILENRFFESRRLSFEERGMMFGSATEVGIKAIVKQVVKKVVDTVVSGGVIDLIWPTKLGDDDDKPLREYIEVMDASYPVFFEYL